MKPSNSTSRLWIATEAEPTKVYAGGLAVTPFARMMWAISPPTSSETTTLISTNASGVQRPRAVLFAEISRAATTIGISAQNKNRTSEAAGSELIEPTATPRVTRLRHPIRSARGASQTKAQPIRMVWTTVSPCQSNMKNE